MEELSEETISLNLSSDISDQSESDECIYEDNDKQDITDANLKNKDHESNSEKVLHCNQISISNLSTLTSYPDSCYNENHGTSNKEPYYFKSMRFLYKKPMSKINSILRALWLQEILNRGDKYFCEGARFFEDDKENYDYSKQNNELVSIVEISLKSANTKN